MVKLTAFVALALSLLVAGAALAAGDDAPGWAYRLPPDLMSPFCPGRSLADCTSPAAESMRLWIITQEAAGRTRDDVEAELVARYGDRILGAPRAQGIGLGAYLFPLVAFGAGGLLVAVVLRRLTRAAPDEAAPAAPAPPVRSDPELERLVDEELAR